MTTYISMNLNQRINYKASQMNKSKAFGLGLTDCIMIYKTAYEGTGEKPCDCVRTYSRSSRRHFK